MWVVTASIFADVEDFSLYRCPLEVSFDKETSVEATLAGEGEVTFSSD